MTEYISPYDPRLTRWNLQDFEWLRILTTGELPAYNKSAEFIDKGDRLVDKSTVKYRDWTDEELNTIRTNEISKGKTPFDIARYMHSIGKQVPILPPNTSIVRFSREGISYWLSRIVFKIDDVLAFEAMRDPALRSSKRPPEHQSDNALTQAAPPEKPKSAYFSKIGKEGGAREKIKQHILEAVKNFMQENTKTSDMSNERIARQFCKKYNEKHPASIPINKTTWTVYCSDDCIFFQIDETDDKKADKGLKSIKYNTLLNTYIPQAKKLVSTDIPK